MKSKKFPKLPVLFKRKWLKALRSGKYEQAHGILCEHIGYNHKSAKDVYGFCCLGVAGHIQGVLSGNRNSGKGYLEGMKGISKIPAPLRGDNDLTCKLTTMNDRGSSFKKIAAWIDRNL